MNEIESNFSMPFEKIKALELDQLGYNYLVGDHYARLTYRYYNKKVNQNNFTASVFGFKTISASKIQYGIHTDQEIIDVSMMSDLRDLFMSYEKERKIPFEFMEDTGGLDIVWEYEDGPTTAYGEGGYSLLFDRDKKVIEDKYGEWDGMHMNDVIDMLSKKTKDSIATVMLDWVMYNSNRDIYVYSSLGFIF
jgi:hypothetical protein